MAWVSVAVGAVGLGESVYKGLKAKSQDKQAAAEGNSLRRPFEQIPTEDIQNKNIAEENATGGLSAAEKTYAGEQRERGLGSSLEALKETGGGPNDFSQLNNVFNDSLRSQSALDAQLHMQNIKFFTDANKELAGEKKTQFGVNELQPYETKLKEIQDRRIAAQTNENNAIDEGLGYAEAGITSYNSRDPSDSIKKPEQTPYSRNFGLPDLADTSGGAVINPSDAWSVLDPNAASGVQAGANF